MRMTLTSDLHCVVSGRRCRFLQSPKMRMRHSSTSLRLSELMIFTLLLLAMHGIDACKVAKLSKATTVLENVAKDDRTCNTCHKGLAGAQSLKNHIRAEHVGKKKHYCKPCDKYFAESSGLKIHICKHGIRAMFSVYKMFQAVPVSWTS